ncbi:MAG TPA: hypothetical protein VFO21_25785 [Vicinamibacterales bacterium]|jgi:hypothetical protein|nr:hypothetical protein [Vicinamibacterales bacterium]
MTDNDLQGIPRPSQLWKQLSPERKLQAAEAFWGDRNASVEHAEAIVAIAQRIKFRPKSVISLPVEKKAKHLVAIGGVSELVAARLLVAYHLAHQRPMMAAFLEALGIAHEDGLINDEEMEAPAAERLEQAAKTLAAAYPAEDVALYLSTLMWQDPDTWGGLEKVPESRAVA